MCSPDYVWQKTHEAMICLIDSGDIRDRLKFAGQYLTILRLQDLDGLPEDLRQQLDDIHLAYTAHEPLGGEGSISRSVDLMSDDQANELARKILAAYSEAAQLYGRAQQRRDSATLEAVSSPDVRLVPVSAAPERNSCVVEATLMAKFPRKSGTWEGQGIRFYEKMPRVGEHVEEYIDGEGHLFRVVMVIQPESPTCTAVNIYAVHIGPTEEHLEKLFETAGELSLVRLATGSQTHPTG